MAEPTAVYQGNTPTPITDSGLNPIQLLLANYMAVGNPPPFAVNAAFLDAMKTYSDSGVLSPFELNSRTGFPKIPDLEYNTSQGIAYVARGEDVYLLRRAQDCGPNEYRLEEVYIGRRPDIAEGTWLFYAPAIPPGSVSDQTWDGGGDYGGGGFTPPGTTTGSFSFAGLQGSQGFSFGVSVDATVA